jgi:hypothetical protein
MEINARAISGLDPGAIPGGSTITFIRVIAGEHGADQHRQTCKDVCFLSCGLSEPGLNLNANDNFAEGYAIAA